MELAALACVHAARHWTAHSTSFKMDNIPVEDSISVATAADVAGEDNSVVRTGVDTSAVELSNVELDGSVVLSTDNAVGSVALAGNVLPGCGHGITSVERVRFV